MVEYLQMGEPIRKSRLEKWALALREAFFNRSPYRGHPRCLDVRDVLAKIQNRIAHERKFRPRTGRARRPWDTGVDIPDISSALAVAFQEESSLSKLLRFHIYTQAEIGELTPNSAEHWVKVFQWSPFAAWADEILFDPEEAKLWSLGMAIKWIECVQSGLSPNRLTEALNPIDWLDDALRKVRQEWPEYIEQSLRWVKNREGGQSLVPKVFRGYLFVDPDAKQLLINALRNGKVQAVGIKSGIETRISSQSWATLRVVGRKNLDGADRVVDATAVHTKAGEGRTWLYDSVYVDQRSLRSTFPPPLLAAVTEKGISRAELIRVLKQESAQQGGRRVSQRAAQDLLAKENLSISREMLRQTISELWPAPPGRPRKSAK